MKKAISVLICLMLALCAAAAADNLADLEQMAGDMLNSSAPFKKQAVKGKYKTMKDLGADNQIESVYKNDDGCLIQARVHYGADYYQDPYLDVCVAVDNRGAIAGVAVVGSQEHTPEFLNLVTQQYLDGAYVGRTASPTLVADGVSGATYSSDAVLFAVRLGAAYAANVFGWGEKDALDVHIQKLMQVVPGSYEKLDVDAAFASDAGQIQYAAQGKADSGADFCALVVQCAFAPDSPDNNMTLPIYQIWIDRATHQIFMANMLAGRFYEGFEMPPAALESYYGVTIHGGDVFDAFAPGLVVDAPEYVVTSATGSFEDAVTGATPQGNDTSRAVRNCFIAATQYYCAHVK